MKMAAKMTGLMLCALLLSGCGAILPALFQVANGAQWLGSVLDAADAGQQAFFNRHPNVEAAAQVREAVRRARLAQEALDGALAVAQAVDDGDLQAAKEAALKAYAQLRQLLDEFGILEARSPAGGPETDAPSPEPLPLPQPSEVAARLGA